MIVCCSFLDLVGGGVDLKKNVLLPQQNCEHKIMLSVMLNYL